MGATQVICLSIGAGSRGTGSPAVSSSVKMHQLESMVKPGEAAALRRGWGMTAGNLYYLPAGTWL